MSRVPRDTSLFINRELSWLAFNERVLEEASDSSVPLLERVKFAAIAASNLDEFFMVRVAGLKRAVENEETAPDPSGLTPLQQLTKVADRVRQMTSGLGRLVNEELLPALDKPGIRILPWSALSAAQASTLGSFFRESIMPVLTPLAIDVSRPFPLLASLSLNLALLLDGESPEGPARLAIVQVPPGLNRMVRVPGSTEFDFVLLEEIIQAHVSQLFPGQQLREVAPIRLARDSELELDDEGARTHLENVEHELKRRRRSDVVRLEIAGSPSAELITLLQEQLDIESDDVYVVIGALDLRVLFGLVELPGFDALRDPPLEAVNVLAGDDRSIFEILDERDVLLHHPYESFEPVMALLAAAADDPDVLAIKMTLYRVGTGSPIVASLRRAAEANKQVTVLVELTARFDEERNIRWARALEEAGAHVIYGVRGYKTHAKMCLIVRRSAQGLRRYLHLGTGNYNERTARVYTDFGLMTSSRPLCEDASAVFNAISGYSDPPRLKKAMMAPTGLRTRLLKLIDRERRRAESGQPAEIVAKMNSLVDVEIIEALYAASRSGVKIRLNVRGVCTLRPCLGGTSENIDVVSIVDRFLEHSRVYLFHNGGDEDVYVGSADWMPRNLDRRIELMFPVDDPAARQKVIFALRAMFRDTVKARWLGADGAYRRRRPRAGETKCRVQQLLQEEAKRAATAARHRGTVAFQPQDADTSETKAG
jgi:polyphosphate kinase